MPHKFDFYKVISILKRHVLVSRVEIVSIDETGQRGFYKLRCYLIPQKFKLEIKFINTEDSFLYPYQLVSDKALSRWDNEPHYPGLENFPHHYHEKEKIKKSLLEGIPEKDIKEVLSLTAKIIADFLI
jgi:hypothetical protein